MAFVVAVGSGICWLTGRRVEEDSKRAHNARNRVRCRVGAVDRIYITMDDSVDRFGSPNDESSSTGEDPSDKRSPAHDNPRPGINTPTIHPEESN